MIQVFTLLRTNSPDALSTFVQKTQFQRIFLCRAEEREITIKVGVKIVQAVGFSVTDSMNSNLN